MLKKITFYSVVFIAVVIGGFFYFRHQVYFSHGSALQKKVFEIKKGDGNEAIGENLEKEGLISSSWYFYYYVQTSGSLNKFLPGKYELSGNMTIPEVVSVLIDEENILPGYKKVTFPEGWTSRQMAERLTAEGFDGQGFLKIANNPSQDILGRYSFFASEKQMPKSLEGYLFPDTYFFAKNIEASGIIQKMLDNFDKKFDLAMRSDIVSQKKTIREIVTMASIIEEEVKTDTDRRLVSGIFWNRISVGQALQSDATLTYILGDKNDQHSVAQTKIDSPYNTYQNRGLPPGPICNPGLSSISAALYPQDTDFNYFLTANGKTFYARTFAEHVANKTQQGL